MGDNASCDVDCDADGAVWESYTGEDVLDRLEVQLDEVKSAYNEKYPCDKIDGEVGCRSDGARESKMEEVLDLLDEVKGLYSVKYWPDHADEVESTRQSTNVEELEALLNQVKALYKERFPLEVNEDDVLA